jgi:glucose/arabinose dehydrogenase
MITKMRGKQWVWALVALLMAVGLGSTARAQESAGATNAPDAVEDVALNEVFYWGGSASEDWVEIRNTGSEAIDVGDWWLCARFQYGQLNSLPIVQGDDFMLEPGELLVVQAHMDLDSSGSDLGLYTTDTFADPAAMVDFVQWGTDQDVGRAGVATTKGIWQETAEGAFAFAPVASEGQSLAWKGTDSGGNGLTLPKDWGNAMPTQGMENTFAAEQPMIALEPVVEGLTSPVMMKPAPDESGRLFIVDQVGAIRILNAAGELLETPFLDLQDQIVSLESGFDERGLLGVAFHPNFAENGRFFVYYSAPLREEAPDDWDHTSHISEFLISETDPNQVDPTSERILLQVDQPQSNHNAGQITFGPDGYLYIPLGDGGGANDVGTGHPDIGNGQDTSTLLGSILRIDVDSGDPYAIPADNPFVGEANARDEIFAYGFRNPFRIAFDTGGDQQLFVGDAGQDRWEEVDIVTSGNNYGWNIKEGTHCFDPDNPTEPPAECPDVGPVLGNELIGPIIEYKNANAPDGIGLVVIGGHIYRGNALPQFQGDYIFGDWSTSFSEGDGTLFVATPPETEGELWPMQELAIANRDGGRINTFVLSFGRDAENELYVLTSDTAGPTGDTGTVYKIVPVEEDLGEMLYMPLVRRAE